MILRVKILLFCVFKLSQFYLLFGTYISININHYTNHENINFIPQELKNIIKTNKTERSKPCELLLNLIDHKLVYICSDNEDRDVDVFNYASCSLDAILEDMQRILITVLYMNEQLRYTCNDYIKSKYYIRISLEKDIPASYDELKFYPVTKMPFDKWLDEKINKTFDHYGTVIKYLFPN